MGRLARSLLVGSIACAAFSPTQVAAAPGMVAPRPRADAPPPARPSGKRLAIAGGAVAGTGLLLAGIGFSVLAGINVGNPCPGLCLSTNDPEHARHIVAVARSMEGLAYAGVGLLVTGTIIAIVGGTRLRAERRARKADLALAPGIGSLTLVGRF